MRRCSVRIERAGAIAACLAIVVTSGCVNKELWRKKQIHKAHIAEAKTSLQEDKPELALANFNAAIKLQEGSDETYKLRHIAVVLVVKAQLERAQKLVQTDGLEVLRIVTALRGSGPLGINVKGDELDNLATQAAQTEWRKIEELASAHRYYPALVRARAVAAATPNDATAESKLRALGQTAAVYHRNIAQGSPQLRAVREFHSGLAELMAEPLKELRHNIHETSRDRPNDSAVVARGGGQDCTEILRAIEDELRASTTQIVKVTFSLGFCPVGGITKSREETYRYIAKIPYQVKGYTYVSEQSGSLGGQTSVCTGKNVHGRCTSYGVVATKGMATYRLVKKPAMITKYRSEERTGTRVVKYTEYNAGAIGTAIVSVAGNNQSIQVKAAAKSDKSRQEAVSNIAGQVAGQVSKVSRLLADRLAADLRRQASAAADPMVREQFLLLALAVLGQGREVLLDQRYGIDGTVVRDILEKKRRWPPIGLPQMVALPDPGKTDVEIGIDDGRLRPPESLDQNTGSRFWGAFQIRDTYLERADRINAIELGFKGDEARIWMSLGLKALGGDASSFELATETRFRGYLVSALVGAYFALEIGEEPADEMLDRNAFAGLGLIGGGQLNLWWLEVSSRLYPNAFQIFGTGDKSGTSRPTPWMNTARLNLPLGFFAQAGGGYYLGIGDSWVWNLSAGWSLKVDD